MSDSSTKVCEVDFPMARRGSWLVLVRGIFVSNILYPIIHSYNLNKDLFLGNEGVSWPPGLLHKWGEERREGEEKEIEKGNLGPKSLPPILFGVSVGFSDQASCRIQWSFGPRADPALPRETACSFSLGAGKSGHHGSKRK